jgi:hypothetical protein
MPQHVFEKLKVKPTIYLFADPDGLGLSFVNYFLSNFCNVLVITENKNEWFDKTKILKSNNNFKINSLEDNLDVYDLSYSIFIDTYLNRNNKEITNFIKINKNVLGKKFVLFPFQVFSQEEVKKINDIKTKVSNGSVDVEYFYIGDILGPNLNENSYPYKIINNFRQGIAVKDITFLYPILSKNVVKYITDVLFSFGPQTNEIALLGETTSSDNILNYLVGHKVFPQSNLKYYEVKRYQVGNFITEYFQYNLGLSLNETIEWLTKFHTFKTSKKNIQNIVIKPQKQKFVLPKVKLNGKPKLNFANIFKLKKVKVVKQPEEIKTVKNKIVIGILSVIVGFSLPLLMLLLSLGLSFLSFNSLNRNNKSLTLGLLNVGKYSSNLTSKTLEFYRNFPLVGEMYKYMYLTSSLLKDTNTIAEKAFKIYDTLSVIPQKMFGNDLYSVSDITKDVYLEVDSLYKDLGFLLGDLDSLPIPLKNLFNKYVSFDRLKSARDSLLAFRNVSNQLDEILGAKSKKTYLIIFQNNMELRPTGGFIGSFALLTIEGGRVIDLNIQDVYSADGQLKGHVEPPFPIKKYLGEAGWYLRDSNWDPDFENTAGKIEWFLEKEIDQKVDGVFAIDLEVIKELLKVTGPITLTDYDITIDQNNVYETTQSQVEDNFFPGSRKKSNYLTSLAKDLLNEVITKNLDNYKIAKLLINGLEQKHIQLFFHNNDVQKEIEYSNFDGGVVVKNCIGNCYYNFASYVDANVGVNKSNYFIERSATLNVYLTENKIANSLVIVYKNNANPVLGDKVRYKSYVRALGVPGSTFNDIKIFEYDQEKIVIPEIESKPNYKEAGALINVGPGEEKSIEFSWSTNLPKSLNLYSDGFLGTYFRKQAGTLGDRLAINLYLPKYMKINEGSFFTLTGYGSYVYNTLLTRDIFPHIYW